MNTLSLLIYAVEVLSGIKVLVYIAAALSAVIATVIVVGRLVLGSEIYSSDLPTDERPEGSSDYQTWLTWKRYSERRLIYVLPIALLLVGTLIPSSKTVYMIAASEAGEAVVTSPDAQEIMGDLKAVIKRKLKDQLGDDAAGER